MTGRNLKKLLAKPGVAHFVGIGGVGMAALAFLMRRLGWTVTGCDSSAGKFLPWLESVGVGTSVGHDPEHVAKLHPDIVVRTPAVHDDNPELKAAVVSAIPVVARGNVLAALSSAFTTFAICGSHGKTTTSSFLASIMRREKPAQSWWCVGGATGTTSAVAGAPERDEPGDERFLVVEADESDGTLACYSPFLLVVTNIDLDHADAFADVAAFEKVFLDAIARTTGFVLYCADHQRTSDLIAKAATDASVVSFGFSGRADWRICSWRSFESGVFSFVLQHDDEQIEVSLPVPGRHNALNAAAAIAAAAIAGIDPRKAAAWLSNNAALPDRRFQKIGTPDGFCVISDYSHHPAEIRALVETAASMHPKRIVAVFQPHRYSRTRTFLDDFPPAFDGVDSLVLCPVYAASEDPIPGGTSADLYAAFRKRGIAPVPVLADSLDSAFEFLAGEIRRGDMVLVIGAGDVNRLCERLADVKPAAASAPAPLVGAYGTRAPVPHMREVSSEAEISSAAEAARALGVPLQVVGAGTNTFVSPTGFRGVLIRLSKAGFSYIAPWERVGTPPNTDEQMLEVGAATPGAMLLSYCSSLGLSGLEFMVGIPGVVGGYLAMNAGVRGNGFCDLVESVRCIRISDGSCVRLKREDLRASYRECPGLEGFVAVSIRLALRRSSPEAVRKAMKEASAARTALSGLRTCGSVFRNPGGLLPPAGALSDRAGCKSLRIGGAFVTDFHANVIATEPGATASDVMALFSIVRDRVKRDSGIELEPEIRILR